MLIDWKGFNGPNIESHALKIKLFTIIPYIKLKKTRHQYYSNTSTIFQHFMQSIATPSLAFDMYPRA